MKEIVVISGKGGTGKTSITASYAVLGGKDIVVADCDVDAADMHLLLEPDFSEANDFYSGFLPELNQDLCTQCGECAAVCRFNAIPFKQGRYVIDELACEGCGYCAQICPVEAIKMVEQNVGTWYISGLRIGSSMVHARLGIGAENSGKLVAKVKKEAKALAEKHNKNMVIVDGSPGVGCPVVSSLSGANFVVFVTEPSVSGLHDLKRVHQLVKKFQIRSGCIINKHDLNAEINDEIEKYLNAEDIILLAKIPYDESFTEAMTIAKTIVEYKNNDLSRIIKTSWNNLKEAI
ncbi:MAG: ATP-binding protein [Calditrichaceae bacterium]|nr:ATP-binding protein [Calditrichaceae bacterium]